MKKYLLGECLDNAYNASSKARNDINLFVSNYGYSIVCNNDKRNIKSNYGKIAEIIKVASNLLIRLKEDDILFVQSSLNVLPIITTIKKIKHFRIVYLIHDLGAVRDCFDDKKKVSTETNKLNSCDIIICHNKSMHLLLQEYQVKPIIYELQLFDYFSDGKNETFRKREMPVVFAGNLSRNKSKFLYSFDFSKWRNKINVYGKKDGPLPNNVCYLGKFDATILPNVIKGGWGLVWEDSEDVYVKNQNPYIMYNNPHKVSLYIASKIPIIIWEKAALANFIKCNHLGITISSLNEVNDKIASISESEYLDMLTSLEQYSIRVRKGYYIHKALEWVDEQY